MCWERTDAHERKRSRRVPLAPAGTAAGVMATWTSEVRRRRDGRRGPGVAPRAGERGGHAGERVEQRVGERGARVGPWNAPACCAAAAPTSAVAATATPPAVRPPRQHAVSRSAPAPRASSAQRAEHEVDPVDEQQVRRVVRRPGPAARAAGRSPWRRRPPVRSPVCAKARPPAAARAPREADGVHRPALGEGAQANGHEGRSTARSELHPAPAGPFQAGPHRTALRRRSSGRLRRRARCPGLGRRPRRR